MTTLNSNGTNKNLHKSQPQLNKNNNNLNQTSTLKTSTSSFAISHKKQKITPKDMMQEAKEQKSKLFILLYIFCLKNFYFLEVIIDDVLNSDLNGKYSIFFIKLNVSVFT